MKEPVTIYEDAHFQGPSAQLDVGRYDWGQLGIKNDSLSSLKIPRYYEVTLYGDVHFQGRIKVFPWLPHDQNIEYVGDDFNDITSSIIIDIFLTHVPH
jgi:hypothetical protein